jgi:hypothetical protein
MKLDMHQKLSNAVKTLRRHTMKESQDKTPTLSNFTSTEFAFTVGRVEARQT